MSDLAVIRAQDGIIASLNAEVDALRARVSAAERLVALWDKWEGRMILDPSSWNVDGGFSVTGRLYDDYIQLQDVRAQWRDRK